jgi:hypothetical protein
MIAGKILATAVPEVVNTAAGLPVLIAEPKAKNAADLSSILTCMEINPCFSASIKANEMGPFLDPGANETNSTPVLINC